MAGATAICPEFRHIHDGVELADSYCVDAHKWLYTNFDCSCFYVKDRAALIRSLTILPEYLKNQATESGAVIDYRDWHVPLGRRFRALKLWFVIRHYGAQGLRHHIARHVELAQTFARWVEDSPDFELTAPTPLNLVCFRHKAGDHVNKKLIEALNDSGRLYLTHTILDGKFTLRFSVAQTHTEERHVTEAWRLIQELAASRALRP
jgi:aromatic-L-amino-acid decarboxylase